MRLPKFKFIFLAALCSVMVQYKVIAKDYDIVVVANIDNKSVRLDKIDIRNLFMGNASEMFLEPITLPPETLARAVFNTKVIVLTESRIQSYWSQMRFSGRSRPPKEMSNLDALLEYVSEHKGTVAFVPASADIPSNLTVVYKTQPQNTAVNM